MDTATALQTTTESEALSVPRFLSLVSQNMTRVDPKLRPFAELALRQAGRELLPATKAEFAKALLPRLALVAPSGMTEANRQEWLKGAWIALDGVPANLLAQGCAATGLCDHPAKIVPAILREIEDIWSRRKGNRSEILAAIAKMEPPAESKEPRCTPEEAAAIIKRAGLKLSD